METGVGYAVFFLFLTSGLVVVSGQTDCPEETYENPDPTMYPYGAGLDREMERVDDGPGTPVSLANAFTFYGRQYTHLFINTNGPISFGEQFTEFVPNKEATLGNDFLACFHNDLSLVSDLGTIQVPGMIYYRQTTDGTLLRRAARDVQDSVPGRHITPVELLIVTWRNVTYLGGTTDDPQNTFQAVLVLTGFESYLLCNYEQISWYSINNNPACAMLNDGVEGKVVNIGGSGTQAMMAMPYLGNQIGVNGRFVMATHAVEGPRIPGSKLCHCTANRNTLVNTFDDEPLQIMKRQKTMLASTRDLDDPCRFQLKVLSHETEPGSTWIVWATFSVGVHPSDSTKFHRNVALERKDPGGMELRGFGGIITITDDMMPYSWTSQDGQTSIQIIGNVDDGWRIIGTTCPYQLVYRPHCGEPQLEFHISGDYADNHDLYGICQNCDGRIADDRRTCDRPPDVTGADVRGQSDYVKQISDSCDFT